MDIVCILHNIRSAHNVGAMFRTAECAGVKKIVLSGYSSAPVNRFGFPQKELVKAALGAEKIVPWTHVQALAATLRGLKAEGYTLVALEQSPQAIDYRRMAHAKIALIVGNEVTGVSSTLLKRVDCIAEIPLFGKKESLNVCTALGIALFRWVQK